MVGYFWSKIISAGSRGVDQRYQTVPIKMAVIMSNRRETSARFENFLRFIGSGINRCNPYAGEVGEGDFSVDYFHAGEAVVGNKQVAVEVGKVGQRGKLRRCAYRT